MSRFPHSLLTVYAANGLNGVVSVISVPVAVRLLGLSGYGLLSFYALMAGYILLADFGIGKNLLRLLAESRDPEAKQRHIRVAAGLYIALCLAWVFAAPFLVVLVPRYLFPVSPEHLRGAAMDRGSQHRRVCLGNTCISDADFLCGGTAV